MKKDEMERSCSMHRRNEMGTGNFISKHNRDHVADWTRLNWAINKHVLRT
jgi:hypothetical protein